MRTPVYYLKDASFSFADKLIFQAAELYIYQGDKICLIGRNGSGKSSLLKIINAQNTLNSGTTYTAPNIKIAYLDQNPLIQISQSIYQFLLGDDNTNLRYKADMILSGLDLDGNKQTDQLSGGQIRRMYLAKTLIDSPDILLLDEPTNHLDIKVIDWLENFINQSKATLVCISHDRRFLSNITNKVWWIEQCRIRKSDQGFVNFEIWQEQVYQQQAQELQKLGKKLALEDDWLIHGVSGRRKRNQKRLADLISLRAQISEKQAAVFKTNQKISADAHSENKTQFIIEAENIAFGYDQKNLFSEFNIRIKKGEKIGIVGSNGSGKTTLVKLLTKQIQPLQGLVKHGANLEISYLDQNRSALNMEQTLQENISQGTGPYIQVNNKMIHVSSYLKQFMFDTNLLDAKLSILSGGQANRVLLAKLLIKPGNLLILDEPTNDLDMETIDILVEILSDYNGTCIIVSHDRDFLHRLVNKTLVFNNNSKIIEVTGSYDDYIKNAKQLTQDTHNRKKTSNSLQNTANTESGKISEKKLSYTDKRNLELLPSQIKALEADIANLERLLTDPDLYLADNKKYNLYSNNLKSLNQELENKIDLWVKLEDKSINT